jgi:hypothetical protein
LLEFINGTKMANTKSIGNISEAYCTARFIELGWKVYFPFGDNERFDILIERAPDIFEKVQIKTARLKDGYIESSVCSSYAHRKRPGKNYRNEVQWIAMYCAELKLVYLIKPEDAPERSIRLRVKPAKNNQEKI